MLSEIYVGLGRNTDALAAVQKAVSLNSRDWSILAQRGDVYRRLGKFTESIADDKAAIVIWLGALKYRAVAVSQARACRDLPKRRPARIRIVRLRPGPPCGLAGVS